ncbi:MAG: hypothetical protein ACON3Z_07585 [Bradymonadia bacterium]
MRLLRAILLIFVSISPGNVFAGNEELFSVIGVHRGLELDGRRVHSGRRVFLSRKAERTSKIAVGDVLTVYRQGGLPFISGQTAIGSRDEMPAFRRDKNDVGTEVPERAPRNKIRRGGRIKLRPSNDLGDTDIGRPAGFANPKTRLTLSRNQASSAPARRLKMDDEASIRMRVGTIRIIKIRNHIVVGEVVEDGLKPGESGHGEELTAIAIMAGDIAESDENLTVRERAKSHAKPMNLERLKKERDRLIDASKRLKRKRKPFTRPKMQWRL